MTQLSRRTFLEIASLASAGLIGGCGGVTNMTGSDNFSVPVFSDVHFQPFIDPFLPDRATLNPATMAANKALVAQLDAKDASAWPAILAAAGISAPSAVLTDTNYTLLGLALASIKQNLGTSPAVLFTGDFLGHGMTVLYLGYTANKTLADAEAFIDKTLTYVLQQIRTALGTTPVYFTLGNCDSYSDEGPESSFLANNAQQLYTLALNGVGDQQDIINTLTSGGYYSVEPAGMNLMIIALNTFALSPGYAIITTLIDDQFTWFEAQLAAASAAGKKVWLLMHAPPGAVEDTTAESPNDTNGQIAAATMMWTDSNQEQFMGIIEKYPGVIAMSLAGHTHMDEFRLMSPGVALAVTAGISPYFGNNPAYKIFTLDGVSLAPFDYSAMNYDLSTTPAAFSDYYKFSQAYELVGPLAMSLPELFPTLQASGAAKTQYQGAFYSGTLSPINSTNWPVYWCGIGYMDETDFIAAVNSF
jgi:3',5'-cyclic AMP phosphodiesterase CpdA